MGLRTVTVFHIYLYVRLVKYVDHMEGSVKYHEIHDLRSNSTCSVPLPTFQIGLHQRELPRVRRVAKAARLSNMTSLLRASRGVVSRLARHQSTQSGALKVRTGSQRPPDVFLCASSSPPGAAPPARFAPPKKL